MKSLLITISVVLLIICITLSLKNHNLKEKIATYQDDIDYCVANLDEANEQIENANGYAWSSYDDMGYVLDDMYPVY